MMYMYAFSGITYSQSGSLVVKANMFRGDGVDAVLFSGGGGGVVISKEE